MERTVLIAVDCATYFIFILKCFWLMENMLYGKRFSFFVRALIAAVNAAVLLSFDLNFSVNTGYIITLVLLFSELWLLFKKSLRDTFFVTLAVMMNIMCLRGIIISLFSFALGSTLYAVCSDWRVFLKIVSVSNLLETAAIYIIMRFMSMDNLRTAMHDKTQSKYIILWAALCVLFMLRSSAEYISGYTMPHLYIIHMSYCFMLLLSFYYLLVYTFRINKAAELREINKSLNKELGMQMVLQSTLTRDAIYTSRVNLAQNKIISGFEAYELPLEHVSDEYDYWFEFARTKVHPDDWELYSKTFMRQNLLNGFRMGAEPAPFEYRHLRKSNEYFWVRIVLRMYGDAESDDVYLFSYAYNIDEEVRSREELVLQAQTDLYTGLYNKATTEKIIGDAVKSVSGLLFLLDVDDFKNVNDGFGHEAGDFVLKFIAEAMSELFCEDCILGRIGGDEFMVFAQGKADISAAKERATELLLKLKAGVDYESVRLIISASIGVVAVDGKEESFSSAYNKADAALYKAKSEGKNRFAIYNVDCGISAC